MMYLSLTGDTFMPYSKLTVEERFWARVNIKENKEECWEWKGSKYTTGHPYGRFHPNKDLSILAHRYSYLISKGEIEEGKEVCHSCDNPSCVNPDHLWLGTHKENMKDAQNKNRLNRIASPKVIGENNKYHKLKDIDVEEIRKSFLNKENTTKELAVKYKVDYSLIYRICTGEKRKYVK